MGSGPFDLVSVSFNYDPPGVGAAKSIVNQRIGEAQQYATNAYGMMADLAGATDSVSAGISGTGAVNYLPSFVALAPSATRPEEPDISYRDITLDNLGLLKEELGWEESTIDKVAIPALDAVAPILNFPDVPTDEMPAFTDDPPQIADPDFPASPSLNIPDEPALRDVTIPNPVSIQDIPFEANLPEPVLEEPELQFVFHEVPYQSELADAIKVKLQDWVVNGGTGLAPDVEFALWVRAKDRNLEENEKSYDEANQYWAARGHEEPPGALRGRIRQVRNQVARANQNLNYEIMITQAKLAQENTHFAMERAVAYEQILMDYANNVQQRALEAARARIDASIAIFNARVAYYNMQLDIYKTAATVYEVRVRAELAKVEAYRTEMEGAKIAQEIESTKVQMYATQVQATVSLIELYRAQLEAARLSVEIGKAKLDQFRAGVEAKIAEIQGITAKYNLWQAQLAGEKTRVELYSGQVDAYGKEVDAAATIAQTRIAEAKNKVESNQSSVSLLGEAVKKFTAEYEADAAKAKSAVDAYTAETGVYRTDVDRINNWVEAKIGEMKLRLDKAIAEVKYEVEYAGLKVQDAASQRQTAASLQSSMAQVSAQVVASALSTVSANASIAYREDLSESYRKSVSGSVARRDSASNSYSESLSESTGA